MSETKHLVLPIVFICAIVTFCFFYLGLIPAVVFFTAFGGGLVLYMRTAWRTRFDSAKVIIPYLLTTLFFMVHTYEEYVTGFDQTVSRLAGYTIPQSNLLTVIAWVAPIIWVSGAIMLIKQWAFGFYFLCAFFFAMTIAELAHFVFPFVIEGRFYYESGMYTALLPLIPAYYGLYVMFQEIKAARAVSDRGLS